MCGIIGIVTSKDRNTAEMIRDSLLRLTYRGYDSYGLAVKSENHISIIKSTGIPLSLIIPKDMKGTVGIGHTRWATHGKVSEQNAHPHTDCDGNIAVVHNGIVDNYYPLREQLKARQHCFKSDTDTEVIPHLIEEKLKTYVANHSDNPFLHAFRDTIRELEGTYAIAALWNGDGKIYAARKTSPLLVGIKQHEYFVSSDISAFIEYTNEFVPLDDDQIAVVSCDHFELFNLELKKISFKINSYPFGIEEMAKGKYKHFMLKEIQEQDRVLQELYDNQQEIKKVASKFAKDINKIQKVYFVGCGSSYHACIAGEYIFERLLGIPSEAVLSSEFKISIRNIQAENSLIVTISQSGETLDTYTVIEEISKLEKKPSILAITNSPYSSEERLIKNIRGGKTLYLHAKPEICVVATKTYTAQLFLLSILALHIGSKILTNNEKIQCTKLLKEAEQVPKKVRQTIDCAKNAVDDLVKAYVKYSREQTSKEGLRENFFIIGRGIHLSTACEAALKLREICYISALGIAGGELKHGSLAAVDSNTPVIVFFPPSSDSNMWKSSLNNFMEIQARGAPIIAIGCEGEMNGRIKSLTDIKVVTVPSIPWLFAPISHIIILQLLSYEMAVKKGINPDYPQNLAKTVTVE